MSIIIHLYLVISSLGRIYTETNNKNHDEITTNKSILLLWWNGNGCSIHVIQRTNTIFSIFDQTILPIAKSLFHFSHAITDVASSGKEVHTASKVNQITLSDICSFWAINLTLLTIRSHQYINANNQSIIYNKDNAQCWSTFLLAVFWVWVSDSDVK